MQQQERFLSQTDLFVDRAHLTFQKPVQAFIDIPLHSGASY